MYNCLGLILTVVVYAICSKLTKYRFFAKFPKVIFAGIVLMLIIKCTAMDYQTYYNSAHFITFLLGPATIAFAIPLIKNSHVLTTNKRAVYAGIVFSTIISILSIFFVAKIMHINDAIMLSMIPKSVTTPIAIEISKALGGMSELTACVAILTGVLGGVLGHRVLSFFQIKNDTAIGLAIGASSHIFGTAMCHTKNKPQQVAISTLSLILVGILTTILAPILLRWL